MLRVSYFDIVLSVYLFVVYVFSGKLFLEDIPGVMDIAKRLQFLHFAAENSLKTKFNFTEAKVYYLL